MSIGLGKVLLAAALIGGGMHVWQLHQQRVLDRKLQAAADSNGFVPIVAASDTPPNTAVILAALNCPSAQAQRADAMAAKLHQLGIPNMRASNYSLSGITREQMPMVEQTSAVLGGEVPIVIINGMAKANPSISEVVAEYRNRT
jgi:hypothetical protein